MKKLITLLAAALLATAAQAAGNETPDSAAMEKALQSLPWERFKAVVSSVPKMKADVDAYGPMGWEFVKKNYRTHGWKRNIDKLDPEQRQRLAELIKARG